MLYEPGGGGNFRCSVDKPRGLSVVWLTFLSRVQGLGFRVQGAVSLTLVAASPNLEMQRQL